VVELQRRTVAAKIAGQFRRRLEKQSEFGRWLCGQRGHSRHACNQHAETSAHGKPPKSTKYCRQVHYIRYTVHKFTNSANSETAKCFFVQLDAEAGAVRDFRIGWAEIERLGDDFAVVVERADGVGGERVAIDLRERGRDVQHRRGADAEFEVAPDGTADPRRL